MARQKKPSGKKRKIFRLPTLSLENDIRYRGPLSYQHFQILGWICIVLLSVVMMMSLAVKANSTMQPRLGGWIDVLQYVTDLSLPLLLVANFSLILNSASGYRKQLLKNVAAMLGLALVFWLVFNKYIVGTFTLISDKPEETFGIVSDVIRTSTRSGFFAFNLFVDLFLCTVFMFFLNYKPKRVFTGKALIVFRLFALLPIAYEAACVYFKIEAAYGRIMIPVNCYPLLTMKPPMTFVFFVIMAVFIKTRELRFCRHGRTHEDYQKFLLTNRNSLHFSVFAAVMMLISSIIDFLILVFGAVLLGGNEEAELHRAVTALIAVGFGGSAMLIFLAPVMLLFSYTRIPKNKMLSTLIPVAGFVLIGLIVIQGMYQILIVLDLPRTDLQQLGDGVRDMIETLRVPAQ